MIFSKIHLLMFVAAQGVHAKFGVSAINCADRANKEDAMCICRFPKNQSMKICQELVKDDGFDTLIVNGEEVEPNVYPWFARATLSGSWAGCGGSLVTPEYVLTAAHCVDDREDSLTNNGGYQIGALCAPYGPDSSDNCQQEVESFGINEIIKHPDYDSSTTRFDFALVRLDDSSTITPVDMDTGDISPNYENLSSKDNLWPIGFGTTSAGGSVTTKLMHVNVNYVKQSTCNSNSKYDGKIFDDMMCASDTNQDSCQGDSGGPLYDSENNALVGVVSWGYGCAQAAYPGVYSRVSNQFTWIKEVICEPGAHNGPRPSFCDPTGPTASPTEPGPTASPTQCVGKFLEYVFVHDSYPSETTWVLHRSDGAIITEGGAGTSGTPEMLCLPSNDCYEFTIYDSYGDGMCCAEGDGSYTLTWDDSVVGEGGEFLDSETIEFGDTCEGSPTKTPTESPIDSSDSGDGFVKISAFQAMQKLRSNGKIKPKLFFRVKNEDNTNVVNAIVYVNAYYTASGTESYMVKNKDCVTNFGGRCHIKLEAYDQNEFSQLNVTVALIDSDLGEYNPDNNKKSGGCPLFSDECPDYTFN